MKRTLLVGCLIAAFSLHLGARAQGLPRTQPKYLQILREEVKVGHGADHAKHEAGWPAAYEKAKSPDYYLALVSITGSPEAWYLFPTESHAQMEESMKREDKDPVLAAELARLALADAAHVNRTTTLQFVARPDLGMGSFPDIAKMRFFEISLYRTHPGKDDVFAEIAKAYGAARTRVAPKSSARVYQLTAGATGPLFLVISSVPSYGDFDQDMADAVATFKGATPQEQATFMKWGEAVASEETHRFRLDPAQSYVPKEVRSQDPEFWQTK